MTEAEIRIQMVAACKTLEADGLNRGASGNLSVRFGEHMLITPKAVGYDVIEPEMMSKTAISGEFKALTHQYCHALAIGGGQLLSDAQIEKTSQGFENHGIRTKEAI